MAEFQTAERRASWRFVLRLPVAVSYTGHVGQPLAVQTRDISARGICFYMDAPLAVGSDIQFTMTLPPEITLTESIRVRCKGKVVRIDDAVKDAKVPVAAVIDEYESGSQLLMHREATGPKLKFPVVRSRKHACGYEKDEVKLKPMDYDKAVIRSFAT